MVVHDDLESDGTTRTMISARSTFFGALAFACMSPDHHVRQLAPGPIDGGAVGQSLLPAHAYTDAAWFADEQQSVFARGWVWAGYEHWVSEVGDVHPVTIAGQPLLLVRGRDGIEVFPNVCGTAASSSATSQARSREFAARTMAEPTDSMARCKPRRTGMELVEVGPTS